MRIPKPKSAPGLLLWGVTATAILALGRVVWVLVGQNIETVSADKGYDKFLLTRWPDIMAWLAENGFWLSLLAAAFLGAALALWAYVILQPSLPQNEVVDLPKLNKWHDGKTRFTLREAGCFAAGVSPIDFETNAEAQSQANEMVHYARQGLIRPAEMTDRQFDLSRMHGVAHGFDLGGVNLDTFISKNELDRYVSRDKTWLHMIDEINRS